MSESRWKYATEVVTVGANSQEVRELTAGEQRAFSDRTAETKGGEGKSVIPRFIVCAGAINPKLTDEDVDAMPPALMMACFNKILELSGLTEKKAKAPSEPSKG